MSLEKLSCTDSRIETFKKLNTLTDAVEIKANQDLSNLSTTGQSKFDAKANKATTLAGYGISDAYTKTQSDTLLDTKANKATTLSGYGITNAYTKTETSNLLNNKADISKMVNAGSYISNCIMPSSKYVDLTLGATGSSYTAPANGWFSLCGRDTLGTVTNYGFVMRRNDRFGVASKIDSTAASTGWCNGSLPARKGDVIYIYHTMTISDCQFRFIYAEGEV